MEVKAETSSFKTAVGRERASAGKMIQSGNCGGPAAAYVFFTCLIPRRVKETSS